jgi:hypothetical protein
MPGPACFNPGKGPSNCPSLAWENHTGERLNADLFQQMDEGLAELENGLRM